MKDRFILRIHGKLAKEHGLQAAVVFNHICFWLAKNKEKGLNIVDGVTLTTTSYIRISERLWFLSEATIKREIKKLTEAGLIKAVLLSGKGSSLSYSLTIEGAKYDVSDRDDIVSDDSVSQYDSVPLKNDSVLPQQTIPSVAYKEQEDIIQEGEKNSGLKTGDPAGSREKRTKKIAPEKPDQASLVEIKAMAPVVLSALLDPEPEQTEDAKDISECIHLFAPFNPNIAKLYGNKTQRKAAAELLEQYGLPWIEETLAGIVNAWRDGDPYVPKVHNPWLFQTKLADIQDWHMRRINKKRDEEIKLPKVIVAPKWG